MPSIEVLIAFTAAALLMNISPGPSNLYVMARAIAQGTQGGIVAAMGLAVGSLVHVVATVLGLSAIFAHSPTLYMIVKLTGAAYLIYLGITYWKSKTSGGNEAIQRPQEKPLLSVFQQSVIVEVTNPKTALFFIALLPQFVVPESGPVSQQLLVLGIIVTISALPCDILVAVSSSKISNWLVKHERAQQIQDRISGSILFAMGAYIVSDEIINSKV
ncbi:LysE family translocator [Desulforhopalus sp. IMCC35007]|uniref:LysE family translocator n=1 Tax=Desulforhopalus sp. IMCC35007 TaxID=2569543 RepID=UPI0010AE81AF|nr:LysE family translocator [Desulforhopalus sp. IMCC35007]TKB06424.1 LysE family translocator [Desulforhopalus sp. IMCC35007]